MHIADTHRAILAELDDGDKTVGDIAGALGFSSQYIADELRALSGECHCVAGTKKEGTYRRGPMPDGFFRIAKTISEAERKAQILACVQHWSKPDVAIAAEIGITAKYTNRILQKMIADGTVTRGPRIAVPGGGARFTYRATNWTPPPEPITITLPAWAAPLLFDAPPALAYRGPYEAR